MESFARDELEPIDIMPVLLSEATWDDIVEELDRRFGAYIFAGTLAYPWTGGEDNDSFITGVVGGYVEKRGLLHCLKEHIDNETRSIYDEWEGEEDDDFTSPTV